ncbi:MAG: DUF4202 domain-containing protein [Reichenbachiella sp.]|uniref:DUF4202 domain-containing protein n=1 Tax=Reichenbachiella sp. TaxID=2184521 RepID=UPI00326623CB
MITKILAAIDEINANDPNIELYNGQGYPKELLYSQRMTAMLFEYEESPSDALQIATRGQHIKRWAIPRSDYPMDRKGYLKWRTELKLFHGDLLSKLIRDSKGEEELAQEVHDLVTKKRLKNDPETQKLEDVVCLVFLKYQFSKFAQKHDDEKVVDILKKTWSKMTEKGQERAMQMDYSTNDVRLIQKALS